MNNQRAHAVRFITEAGLVNPKPVLSRAQIRRLVKSIRRWKQHGRPAGVRFEGEAPDGRTWNVPYSSILLVQVEKGTGYEALRL